jgi:hypothetical protein
VVVAVVTDVIVTVFVVNDVIVTVSVVIVVIVVTVLVVHTSMSICPAITMSAVGH